MATREELSAQASACNDAASYAALAKQAAAEPADLDYAKELLAKGESNCSFPAHYVSVAEGYVCSRSSALLRNGPHRAEDRRRGAVSRGKKRYDAVHTNCRQA